MAKQPTKTTNNPPNAMPDNMASGEIPYSGKYPIPIGYTLYQFPDGSAVVLDGSIASQMDVWNYHPPSFLQAGAILTELRYIEKQYPKIPSQSEQTTPVRTGQTPTNPQPVYSPPTNFATNPIKVFTQSDLANLNNQLRKLHDLLPVIDAASNCGVECDNYREVIAYLQDQLTALKTNFMQPNQLLPG